jgi:hypothetical protein
MQQCYISISIVAVVIAKFYALLLLNLAACMLLHTGARRRCCSRTTAHAVGDGCHHHGGGFVLRWHSLRRVVASQVFQEVRPAALEAGDAELVAVCLALAEAVIIELPAQE